MEDGLSHGDEYLAQRFRLSDTGVLDEARSKKNKLAKQKHPGWAQKVSKELRLPENNPFGFDRDETFGSTIASLRQIVGAHGVELPNDLIERIIIPSSPDESISLRLLFESGENVTKDIRKNKHENSFILPNGLVVVNFWQFDYRYVDHGEKDTEKKAKDIKRRDDYIREEGVARLIQSLARFETNERPGKRPRIMRSGIYVRSAQASYGLRELNAQFRNYLTRKTLEENNYEIRKKFDLGSHTIDALVEEVGEEPFVRAYFSDETLKILEAKLDKFGKHTLWKAAKSLEK